MGGFCEFAAQMEMEFNHRDGILHLPSQKGSPLHWQRCSTELIIIRFHDRISGCSDIMILNSVAPLERFTIHNSELFV
jgi:hypothetical protein